MTEGRDFKRLVRERMRRTGESYMVARDRLLTAGASAGALSLPEPAAATRFEWLTPAARWALALAARESDADGRGSVDAEHLLLGLFQETEGMAGRILRGLRVDPGEIRGVNRRSDTADRRPTGTTPRLAATLRRAFSLALERRESRVGTHDLLVGLLDGGDGVAVLLRQAGLTAGAVRSHVAVLEDSLGLWRDVEGWGLASIPPSIAADHPVFTVSTASRALGISPQALMMYERLGVISPARTSGDRRRYTRDQLATVRAAPSLTQLLRDTWP